MDIAKTDVTRPSEIKKRSTPTRTNPQSIHFPRVILLVGTGL